MLQSILLAMVFLVSSFSIDVPIVKAILLLLAVVVLMGGTVPGHD
jgi:hypothetical protein